VDFKRNVAEGKQILIENLEEAQLVHRTESDEENKRI
jgi:hypothetical protein